MGKKADTTGSKNRTIGGIVIGAMLIASAFAIRAIWRSPHKKDDMSLSNEIVIDDYYMDYDDNGDSVDSVLTVVFKYTNKTDEEHEFSMTFSPNVYQDGVECKRSEVGVGLPDQYAGRKKVQPGETQTVRYTFSGVKAGEEAKIVVERLWAHGDDRLVAEKTITPGN